MILKLVPLTPAAAPPNRLQGCVFTREFPLRIKCCGVETRFAIDAPDPRATHPDPVLLEEVERARRCFCEALGLGAVSGEGHQSRLRQYQRLGRGDHNKPASREAFQRGAASYNNYEGKKTHRRSGPTPLSDRGRRAG
jgi:hypothetical protein